MVLRRLAPGSLAVALTLASVAVGAVSPTLRVVDDRQLTLRGAQYRPRESVRVTVVMGTRYLSKNLRAGSAGGFTVRFARVRLDYCAVPLVISARGAISGLVRAKVPRRECAQP